MREGFYEAISPNKYPPEEDEEEEEEELGTLSRNQESKSRDKTPNRDSESNKENPDYLPMDFEILLPELEVDRRGEYTQYKE
jgi:hypothetical protein